MPSVMRSPGASDSAFARPVASSQTPSIAIIGGGITGLLFGLALHTHCPHLPFLIYEAASSFGEIGAGVGFSPNASRAMKLISPELHAAFEKLRTPNKWEAKRETWFDLRLGEDVDVTTEATRRGQRVGKGALVGGKPVREGDLIGNIDLGETRGGVHRAHFVDAVQRLMPPGTARFGKRLIDISQDDDGLYILTFSDGTTAGASSVVACDGIKSRCRQVLLGDTHPASRARYTGKYCYRGLIPMSDAIAALGEEEATNSQMYWMHHKHLLTFPIANGKTMNVVAFASKEEWKSEKWIIEASREEMYEDYRGCGEKVKTILEMMQKPDIWALFEHKDAETYRKGGMCLIGDAAHASTPHQGAGAGMGVEDACVLAMLLKDCHHVDDLSKAYQAFDTVRRLRTQQLVKTSREAAEIYELESHLDGGNLDLAIENVRQRMNWIWKHDVEDDIEACRKLLHKTD